MIEKKILENDIKEFIVIFEEITLSVLDFNEQIRQKIVQCLKITDLNEYSH